MSADNGYVLRKNAQGEYVLQHYFDSAGYPEIDDPRGLKFDNPLAAFTYYETEIDDGTDFVSEYGLTVSVDFATYVEDLVLAHDTYLTNPTTNPIKEEATHMLETQKYVRKPFEVEAVQVTAGNMELVARWCEGEVVGEGRDRHIFVNVFKPMSARQTKAYVNDWLLLANGGFKVYTPRAFDKSFDKTDSGSVLHPEVVLQEADRVQELLVTTDPEVEKASEHPLVQAVRENTATLVDAKGASKPPSPEFLAELARVRNSQRS